jgi:hypothetical protein
VNFLSLKINIYDKVIESIDSNLLMAGILQYKLDHSHWDRRYVTKKRRKPFDSLVLCPRGLYESLLR